MFTEELVCKSIDFRNWKDLKILKVDQPVFKILDRVYTVQPKKILFYRTNPCVFYNELFEYKQEDVKRVLINEIEKVFNVIYDIIENKNVVRNRIEYILRGAKVSDFKYLAKNNTDISIKYKVDIL